jgi:Spy/CpxP family protein refolding chaperone
MRILFTVAFICCALVAPTVAHESNDSQQLKSDITRAPRPPSRWWTTEKYRQELRLTAEQSAEIERIVQGSMSRLKGDKEDLDQAQSDFKQLMERPNASERELLKAAERLEMARFSISKERTIMLVRIHSVLTPEQRRGLDAIAQRHEAERSRAK